MGKKNIMSTNNLWWSCPKCNSKVRFGLEIATLFDEENNEALFAAECGVPFYVITCSNKDCDARWNFSIGNMYID